MAVKLRSVHTCELHFPANAYTAGAAHSCAVHHDWVHADDGWDSQLLGELADKFHHNHRSDGNTDIVLLALVLHQILNNVGYHALAYIGTVICGNIEVSCNGSHFLFQNQHILGLGAFHHIHVNAALFQPFYLWVNRRASHAAGYKEITSLLYFLQVILHEFGRLSQGTYEICEAVSGLQS